MSKADHEKLTVLLRPWESGVSVDWGRLIVLADDLDMISEATGNCRISDGADAIREWAYRLRDAEAI